MPGKLLIGEEWSEPSDGATFATIDPATGEEICQIAQGSADDVRRAVEAAQAALDGPLRKVHAAKRSALMNALAELIKANGDELAELESLDNGKPLAMAKGDVAASVEPPSLLRGLADQDRGRDDPGLGSRRSLLHAPRAGRRLRPDRPLELPAPDGDLEDRARARRGMPDRPQAGRADSAHRASPGRARA